MHDKTRVFQKLLQAYRWLFALDHLASHCVQAAECSLHQLPAFSFVSFHASEPALAAEITGKAQSGIFFCRSKRQNSAWSRMKCNSTWANLCKLPLRPEQTREMPNIWASCMNPTVNFMLPQDVLTAQIHGIGHKHV